MHPQVECATLTVGWQVVWHGTAWCGQQYQSRVIRQEGFVVRIFDLLQVYGLLMINILNTFYILCPSYMCCIREGQCSHPLDGVKRSSNPL